MVTSQQKNGQNTEKQVHYATYHSPLYLLSSPPQATMKLTHTKQATFLKVRVTGVGQMGGTGHHRPAGEHAAGKLV